MVWPILSFQGSYINVHLTLIYFLVLKNLLKNCIRDSILHIFPSKALYVLKYFSKIFNWAQYGLIHIVHLVNFDQSLSKSHIVRSMLNFAMFLANSDQEIIRTIRFDPYCPYKVFIKFHFLFQMDLRNWIRSNTIWPILSLI